MESGEMLLQVPGAGAAPRIEITDPAIERRLRAFIDEWKDRPVRIAADDRDDVSGHASADAAVIRVIVGGEDDTEGHAISIRFPNADDAQRFRTKLAAGVLVGAVVIAGAGAASNLAPSIGSSAAFEGTGGTSITMPNVHSDQAIAPAGGISAPTSVHSDQAIAPAGGVSAPSSVHTDQAVAPEAPAVPNVHSDQAVPNAPSSDDDTESRLPRGNQIR